MDQFNIFLQYIKGMLKVDGEFFNARTYNIAIDTMQRDKKDLDTEKKSLLRLANVNKESLVGFSFPNKTQLLQKGLIQNIGRNKYVFVETETALVSLAKEFIENMKRELSSLSESSSFTSSDYNAVLPRFRKPINLKQDFDTLVKKEVIEKSAGEANSYKFIMDPDYGKVAKALTITNTDLTITNTDLTITNRKRKHADPPALVLDLNSTGPDDPARLLDAIMSPSFMNGFSPQLPAKASLGAPYDPSFFGGLLDIDINSLVSLEDGPLVQRQLPDLDGLFSDDDTPRSTKRGRTQ